MKSSRNLRRGTSIVWFGVVALAISACGTTSDGPQPSDRKITIMATTSILGDVAENITGSDAIVEVLIPIGADPHDYQASAQQIAALQRADLVLAIGLGLEGALSDVLDSAMSSGGNVLEVAPLLDPIPFSDDDATGDGTEDPHVWLDPLRVAKAARLIADELATIDDTVDWSGRAQTYADELIAVDDEIRSTLGVVPIENRRLVTNHDALGYFADRYEFKVIGTVIPGGSTLAEPSSAELAHLVDVIRTTEVGAIFVETTESSVLAESVAEEVGRDIRIVVLHTGSLGEPGTAEATLIGMLRSNALLIAEGLSAS